MGNFEEEENSRERHLVVEIKKDKKDITGGRARVIIGTLLSAVGTLGIAYFSPALVRQLVELDAITFNSLFISDSVVAELLLSLVTMTYGVSEVSTGFIKNDFASSLLKKHQKELDDINQKKVK